MSEVTTLVSTGTDLSKRYGFTPKLVPQANWGGTNIKFMEAEEVAEYAEFIIRKWRNDIGSLSIGYVFKQKASKSGDNVTLGQAKAEGDLQRVLHKLDAVMIIGFDTWKDLTTDQKLRLVMHELEHIGMTLDGSKATTMPHLVEEFPRVVQFFGPGNDAQVDMINAYQRFTADMGGKK